MSIPFSTTTQALSSAERWHAWEQAGVDYDVRFMRRARRLFWVALVLFCGGALLWIAA